jgi:hypothetical protein
MKGIDKLEQATNKLRGKLPGKTKVDNQLGLFLHKNIATLFIFDDKIQEYYREMENAVERGDKQEALEISEEMKAYIHVRKQNDREFRQKAEEVSEVLSERGEQLQDKIKKKGAREIYSEVKQTLDKPLGNQAETG